MTGEPDLELLRNRNSGLPLVGKWTSFGRMWAADVVYLPGDAPLEGERVPPTHPLFEGFDQLCQVCDTVMPRLVMSSFQDDGDTLYLCVDTAACEARRVGKTNRVTTLADHERRITALEQAARELPDPSGT